MSDSPSPSASAAKSNLPAHAGTILTMFAWGTLIPVAHVVLEQIDAWTLATLRMVAAAAVLAIVSLCVDGAGWLRQVDWRRAFFLGAAVAGFAALYTLGIALSNPIPAIVVSAAGPVVSAGFASFVERRPLPRRALVAFSLSTLGAAVASLSHETGSVSMGFRGGEILILFASLCWTWYSIKAQSWFGTLGQRRVTSLSYTGAALVLGFVNAVAFLAHATSVPRTLPSPFVLSLFGWMVIGVTIAGGILWNFGVSRIGIIFASFYLNLIPLFGILTAMAFGSYPNGLQVMGCLLVVLGVVFLQPTRKATASGERPDRNR
jgi:drug/metabolite transporter (DMT)-like permease